MKKLLRFLSVAIAFIFVLFTFTSCDDEVKPIDRIDEYTITIDANNDGTLNMNYHIIWTVLDDDKEGPVEWVQIGCPNRFVSDIRANTSNIDSIKYSSDDGAFIRVDFKRKYYKNEVIEFDYSFTQSHMYTFNSDNTKVEYVFRPGWFNEIEVVKATLKVKKGLITDAYKTSILTDEKGYYVWESHLNPGETFEAEFYGLKSSFPNINEKDTYTDEATDPREIIVVFAVIGIIVVLVVVFVIVARLKNRSYYSYRGFSGNSTSCYLYYRLFYHNGYDSKGHQYQTPKVVSGGSHSSGGHSCACACACACAGGGRAGCSRKDFYNPKFATKYLDKE